MEDLNVISKEIIGIAIGIHRELGPGLLESAYEELMFHELSRQGLTVERQVRVPLTYKEIFIPDCYRLDLLVNNSIIIEIKSIKTLENIHLKQLLTYLRLMNKKLGLLINFNEEILKNGIRRVRND